MAGRSAPGARAPGDYMRDPHGAERSPAQACAAPAGSGAREDTGSVTAASGISASAAIRKQRPPRAVPPLASRALIGSPLEGSISEAIAAAPNAIEPSRLSATIHHDSER